MLGQSRSAMRWQEENLDEYETEGEEDRYGDEREYDEERQEYDDDEDEEGEEEEQEEEHKPTPEELEYLSMREKMKAKLRAKVQKENAALLGRVGSSGDRRPPPPKTEFGSFFGPSKPVIARRVIEERNSLLETQHMRAKESTSNHIEKQGRTIVNGEKKPHIASNGQVKNQARVDHLKSVKEIRSKAQTLKDMRDYSFLLSDDCDVPAPAKEPLPRKPPVSLPDVRPAQALPKTKVDLTRPAVSASNNRGLTKAASSNMKILPKLGPKKEITTSKLKDTSAGNIGSGASQIANGKTRPSSSHQDKSISTNKSSLASKDISAGTVGNRASQIANGKTGPAGSHQNMSISANKSTSVVRKAQVVNPGSSSQKQNIEQRKGIQGLPKEKVVAKQPILSSRPQQQFASNNSRPQQQFTSNNSRPQQQFASNKPKPQQLMSSSKPKLQANLSKPQPQFPKPKPSKPVIQQRPQQKPLKRKPISRYSDEEDEDGDAAISMIRKMFGYNPNKYAGADEDDSDMEANFDDIMKEEKRSRLIAQREDEEQLRLIEEEEERERRRRIAKKRRLG